MKIITVVSGKGGTGKTSITASLAVMLSRKNKIVAVDCDVDAPNLALALGLERFSQKKKISTSEKAKLVSMKGLSKEACKKLVGICNFGAISFDGKNLTIDKFLCEGCGACSLLYPKNIKLVKVMNGNIMVGKTSYGFYLVSGQLEIGESGSGKIVTEVKNKAFKLANKEKADIMLVDSAAGIGCPVIASLQGSDFVVAVTEPTPSAFNDLKRAIAITQHFMIPYGLIINKYDINKDFAKEIEEFARKNRIPVLGKIKYDKAFVTALTELKPIVVYKKSYAFIFEKILRKIFENL
ncbi:MAG TPA: P-loop ATPase [Candidatus Pacearchaeota archaeon]|nr:P-loop ATPase [Candidatus Pacearchaeota archaeon]